MRRLCCALLVSLVVVLGAPPADAEATYSPPVDAPVVDPFRAPANPYGPGNRGIDYATRTGEAVRAASDGEVVFAGRVGGSRHVVLLHPDGLRTSYSFLAAVDVARGDEVARGDVVGRSDRQLHFGVRAGERYLDPAALLAGDAPRVHLVPIRGSEADERHGLVRALGGVARAVVGATRAGVDWVRGEVDAAWDWARGQLDSLRVALDVARHYLTIPYETVRLAWRGRRYLQSQADCTPASTAPGAPPPGRRIAILVGGLASASGDAAVLDVDTEALGYADGDVAQFSYRGGQAPGRRRLDGVSTNTYDAADSQGDLTDAAERFRSMLHEVRRAHPGVPVDVIAHSQGGVVVRAALGDDSDALDPRLPSVEHVITLGSPHHGTDLATANAGLGTTEVGAVGQAGVRHVSGRLDPSSTAVAQLAETSSWMEDLGRRPLPAGARFTTVAARGDLTVPALQSALGDATNAIVPLAGPRAHGALPGSPEAHREMALALAGKGPMCRAVLTDLTHSLGVSVTQDLLGLGGLAGGWWLQQHPSATDPAPADRDVPLEAADR